MPALLSVDLGTTSIKVLAFDLVGKVLAEQSHQVTTQRPQADWAEQNPQEIFHGVLEGLNAVYAQVKSQGPIMGIGFSTAMHSLIGLDENDQLLTPSLIWSDNRATGVWENLNQAEKMRWYRISGIPAHPMTPLLKLHWFRQTQADLYARVQRWVGVREYVLHRLCGEWLCDHSVAGASGLQNLAELQWDASLLHDLDLPVEKLPALAPAQRVLPLRHVQFEQLSLQIPLGTPVVLGASDGCLANLGAEASDTDLVVTIGTSSAIRRFSSQLQLDEQARVFCYYLQTNRYLIGGGTNAGAVVLSWLKNQLLQSSADFYDFVKTAENIPAGSEGLLFLPYLQGERAPWWTPKLRGSVFNLDMRHNQAHLTRATMESVVYNLAVVGQALRVDKTPQRIIAGGGFARSLAWVQILADVFQLPVQLQDTPETSSRGAAMLVAQALELDPFPQVLNGVIVEPNSLHAGVYAERLAEFIEKTQQDLL
jgi:gluconokinase